MTEEVEHKVVATVLRGHITGGQTRTLVYDTTYRVRFDEYIKQEWWHEYVTKAINFRALPLHVQHKVRMYWDFTDIKLLCVKEFNGWHVQPYMRIAVLAHEDKWRRSYYGSGWALVIGK